MNKKNDNHYNKKYNYNLFESFKFAFEGIVFALFWERNLRIHLSVSMYLAYFSVKYYNFSKGETVVLVLTLVSVIVAELFNTALEKVVDLITNDYSTLAKIVKDVAAGAVLIAALGSLVIGLVLFWDTTILNQIFRDILGRWYIWFPIIILNLTLIFIPQFGRNRGNDE